MAQELLNLQRKGCGSGCKTIRGCTVTTIIFLGLTGFLLSLLYGISNQYDFDIENDDWFELFPLN